MTAAPTAALHTRVESVCAGSPSAVAVLDGHREISYAELDRRSAAVAAAVAARVDAGRSDGGEPLVGVCLERGADLVVALLGVLRAGAAYVPLDPAYPQERLDFIRRDARLGVVLTDAANAGQVGQAEAVLVSELPAAPDWTPRAVAPDRLAYLIYTSGSTGRPKAVSITHGNATAMLDWAVRTYTADERAGVLGATSVCFDLSVYEMFLPLSTGGTLIVAADALALADLPGRDRVTLVNTVPSAAARLVRDKLLPPSVRTVNLAGEPLPRRLADEVYATGHVERLWNLYGPSEDTTYSTAALLAADDVDEPAIGRPIDGTAGWVLDTELNPVADGEVGELYLSGTGVARGYLGRPGLTADRFLPDPYAGRPGTRMYRTGDLVRRHRGELYFVGRSDSQVKIRGHRIELGEIDAVLGRHPAVGAVVTVVDADPAGEPRLVSYLDPAVVDLAELRSWLLDRLPAYAVPAVLVPVPDLPRTPNGKIDRAALPAATVDREQAGTTYVPPTGELQDYLATVWRELLGVAQVGAADRFDDLGGHSLLAATLLGRVAAERGAAVPLAAFLVRPTVSALAGLVEEYAGTAADRPLRSGTGELSGPPSAVQEGFWITEQLVPDLALYTVGLRLRVTGRIEAAELALALSTVVARHEALRTAFVADTAGLRAEVRPAYDVAVPVTDLRGRSDADAAAEQVRTEVGRTVLDARSGRLLQARLLRLTDEHAELLLAVHHLGFDGWSTGVLTRELGRLLAGADLEPPPVQARDYTAWLRDAPAATRGPALDYWREQLGGADLHLELPADRPRPPSLTFRGARRTREFPTGLPDDLRSLGRRHGGSLFSTLLAGLDVLVHQLTGRTDFALGAQTADRAEPALAGHVGLCINTVAIRLDSSGAPSFAELLRRTVDASLGALSHQQIGYPDVIRLLDLPRTVSHPTLVQVMLAVQNYAVPPVRLPGLTIDYLGELDNGTAKVDLTLFVETTADGDVLTAEYSTDAFTAATVDEWLEQYLAILADAAQRPTRPIAELGSGRTLRRLRPLAVGPTGTEPAAADSLAGAVATAAGRWPQRVAVTDGTSSLTYDELLVGADEIASRLRRQGLGRGDLVAVCVDRHPRILTALLGVLRSGAAYLPVDPDFPADRIGFMLADSGARAMLTEPHLLAVLPPDRPPVLLLDDPAADPREITDLVGDTPGAGDEISDLAGVGGSAVGAGDLAYVLYTSGSTGRPKGVQISHGSMVNFLRAMLAGPGLTAEDRVAALTTLSFDIAGLELWLPLMVGARVVVFDRRTAADGARLAARLDAEGVTVLQATPMTWRLLLAAGWAGRADLRAWCGGEALPTDLAAELAPRVAELWNLYGPTEATIWTSTHRVVDPVAPVVDPAAPGAGDAGGVVPIGTPLAGTTAWVLDAQQRCLPVGAVGELCLGGAGVADGYLGRPGLTADRFVPDPFGGAGDRLYRTGDRARWRSDGVLEFLGRDDDQVKVRGFRIELGEIESVLRTLPGVAAAAAAVRGDDPADQRLVAFVVPQDGERPDPDRLRSAAQAFLPEHMVPSQLVLLDELPLTANRKLDRRRLPDAEVVVAEGTPPGDAFEEIVAEVWSEVLGVTGLTVQANFFALGGHSLLATRVVARLTDRFELPVPVRLVFEAPTIAGMARRIEALLLADLAAEEG